MTKRILVSVLSLLMLGLLTTSLQADLIQCPDGGCNGTDNSDIINGSPGNDAINGLDGDDIIFGGEGFDIDLDGGNGNDILFGGADNDNLIGNNNDDILLPGPDVDNAGQIANGNDGNDNTIVLAGEIAGCLIIDDDGGTDVANLIGFGPYSATLPFGQPGFVNGWILVTDPIAGGTIAISVQENNSNGVETVNGLTSPNVTIDELPQECQP